MCRSPEGCGWCDVFVVGSSVLERCVYSGWLDARLVIVVEASDRLELGACWVDEGTAESSVCAGVVVESACVWDQIWVESHWYDVMNDFLLESFACTAFEVINSFLIVAIIHLFDWAWNVDHTRWMIDPVLIAHRSKPWNFLPRSIRKTLIRFTNLSRQKSFLLLHLIDLRFNLLLSWSSHHFGLHWIRVMSVSQALQRRSMCVTLLNFR